MALKTIKTTTISYKETEEDKELREWVHSHSNLSGFIKDILRKTMYEELARPSLSRSSPKIKKEDSNELIDLGDF